MNDWIDRVYAVISEYEGKGWDIPDGLLGLVMDLQTEIEDSGL